MSWRGLRFKGTERLTSTEWNAVVASLNDLYSMLTSGTEDIFVDEVYGNSAYFRRRIYAEGRPVILDGDPIQVYMFYDIAKEQITQAIDSARITTTADLVREYAEKAAVAEELQLHKLDLVAEYSRESRDVLVRLRIDEYGNVGIKIAEPLDEYGNVVTSIRSDAVGLARESTLQRITNALRTIGLDSLIITTRFRIKVEDGYAFSISHRFEGVPPDETVTMYFENPTNSGILANIVLAEVISLAQAWVDMYRGVTPSGGISITPTNLNLSKTITSSVTTMYGVTFTGGEVIGKLVCPSGGRVNVVGSVAEVGESMIVPPGHNILIAVVNKGGAAADIGIRIIWWEEPLS